LRAIKNGNHDTRPRSITSLDTAHRGVRNRSPVDEPAYSQSLITGQNDADRASAMTPTAGNVPKANNSKDGVRRFGSLQREPSKNGIWRLAAISGARTNNRLCGKRLRRADLRLLKIAASIDISGTGRAEPRFFANHLTGLRIVRYHATSLGNQRAR